MGHQNKKPSFIASMGDEGSEIVLADTLIHGNADAHLLFYYFRQDAILLLIGLSFL
jgi:hypothetical protein